MKKYVLYIVVTLSLLMAAIALYYFRFVPKEQGFAVKEIGKVTKIVMKNTKQQQIVLSRQGDQWLVNEKYPVRQELMSILLNTISRVTSLSSVPKRAHDHVIRQLMTDHVKVQIFAGDNVLKTYYVGEETTNGRGTYMLLESEHENEKRPHITYVPGYQGFLTPIYANMDEDTWRSRVVFAYTEQDIEQLTVKYFENDKASFRINRVSGDSFVVRPLNEQYLINQPNELRYLKQYLAFYQSISSEAFETANSQKDSIMRTTPYCTIEVKNTKGETNKVNMYYMSITKRTKSVVDQNGKPLTYDLDRYYASQNDKDFLVVQYYVFGKILRQYADFFYQPSVQPQLGEDAYPELK